jgi:hypothetical protein
MRITPRLHESIAEIIYENYTGSDNPHASAEFAASEIMLYIHDTAVADEFLPEGTEYEELQDQYDTLRIAFEHYVIDNKRVFEFLYAHGASSLKDLVDKHKKALREEQENDDGL